MSSCRDPLNPCCQALLGIATYPDDSIDHPEAPLLNAGTRRQSACDALVAQALTLGYEEGLVDVPTRDNLAALLALIQMMMCEPSRAFPTYAATLTLPIYSHRTVRLSLLFLRNHSADLHFASQEPEEVEIVPASCGGTLQRAAGCRCHGGREGQYQAKLCSRDLRKLSCFVGTTSHPADALSQYADSGTSAWGRKACVISPTELNDYFGDAGIVVPQLPHDDLLPVLENLLGTAESTPKSFPTAVHLVSCWTCQCQRMFAAMSCSRTSCR